MNSLNKILLIVIFAVSFVVIALQVPSIQKVRNESQDATAASDVYKLYTAVSDYSSTNRKLPDSLDAVKPSSPTKRDISQYKYVKKSSSEYDLCTNFKTDTSKSDGVDKEIKRSGTFFVPGDFQVHPKGEHCFQLAEALYPSTELEPDYMSSYCKENSTSLFCTDTQ